MSLFKPPKEKSSFSAQGKKTRGNFSSAASFSTYFKFLDKYGKDSKAESEMLTILISNISEIEIVFMVEEFFSLKNFSQPVYSFFIKILTQHSDKVRWEDVFNSSLYHDRFFSYLVDSNHLESFLDTLIKCSRAESSIQILFVFGYIRKIEIVRPAKKLPILDDKLKYAFQDYIVSSDPYDQNISLSAILNISEYLKEKGMITSDITASLILRIGKSKFPNLELMLNLLKDLIKPNDNKMISNGPPKNKQIYLRKVDFEFMIDQV